MRRGALALYPFSRPVSGSEAVTPALSLLNLCSGFMICVNRTGLHANVCSPLGTHQTEGGAHVFVGARIEGLPCILATHLPPVLFENSGLNFHS